jgi:anti-sigma B factor antagonist
VTDSRCRVETICGLRVVAAPAVVDVNTTDELRQALLDSAVDGHATVVVDMTGTRSCDSEGLAVLVTAHRRGLAEGGGLRLAVPADGRVARALDLTGVDRFIPSFSSLEEALAAGPANVIVPVRTWTSLETGALNNTGVRQAAEPVGQVAEAAAGGGIAGLRMRIGLDGSVEITARHTVHPGIGDQPQGGVDTFIQ